MKLSDFDKMEKLDFKLHVGKVITLPGSNWPTNNDPMYFEIAEAEPAYNRAMVYIRDTRKLVHIASFGEFFEAVKNHKDLSIIK